jgi:hypothetical protein
MILDGAMMSLVIILLTAAHPGFVLGSIWQTGSFRLRRGKQEEVAVPKAA